MKLAVLYNPEPTPQQADLPGGSWRYLSDGTTAAATPFGAEITGRVTLAPTSVTILERQ